MALSRSPHCAQGPDRCFGCKSRYWRDHGGLAVAYPQGQDFFHNTTVASDIKETLENARADGRELEWVGGGPATPPPSALAQAVSA